MALLAEIDEKNVGKIIITDAEWRYKELLASIPSSKFKADNGLNGSWRFSLTWQTCLALKGTLKDNLEVGPKLNAWMQELYGNVIKPAYELRTQITGPGYDFLFPHQKGDVAFLTTIKRGILANGMGSGKSISAMATIRRLHELGEDVFPVMIACPNSTKYGWEKEIEKVWPGLTIHVVDGSLAKRRKMLETPAHVVIINWESIRAHSRLKPFGSIALKKCQACGGLGDVKETACEAHHKELNEINFKTVIGDEIHRIADPASKVSRAFKAATGDAEFRIAMSGTPIGSSPENLYSPLNWLFPEAYPSKVKFIDRFCITSDNPWGGKIVLGLRPEMEEEFFAGLDPFLRRMPKEIILPFLPPIIRSRRDVEMGTKQARAYKQMKEQMLSEIDNGDVIFTTSPLTKLTRLLQFASSYADVEYRDVYDDATGLTTEKQFVKLTDPSCTLDAFMEDLPDFGDDSTIVFMVSSQLVKLLSARLTKQNIRHGLITGDQDAKTRQMHIDAFQRGEIQFILVTIAAGGTGITLTQANTMVFLQRSWSLIENLQSEGRGHRIGSEKYDHIKIIDYVTKNTQQEKVFEAIDAKSDQLEVILRDTDLIRKFITNELDMSFDDMMPKKEDEEEE